MSRYMLLMQTPQSSEPHIAGPFSWSALLHCASLVHRAGLPVQAARYSPAVAITLRDASAFANNHQNGDDHA